MKLPYRLNRLTMLFILFSLSGLGIVLIMIYMSWQDVRQKAYSELEHVNTFVYSAFEADLYKYDSLLRLLGERLAKMDVLETPEAGRALLERTLGMNPNLAGFGVARPDGQLVLVTSVSAEQTLPNLMQNDVSRKWFSRMLENGKITLGHTHYMALLDKWVVPMYVPIYDRSGKLVLVMAAGINVQSTKNIWQPENLPEHIRTLLVDDDLYFLFVSPLQTERMAAYYEKPVPDSTLAQMDMDAIRHSGMTMLELDNRYGETKLLTVKYHPELGISSVTTIPKRNVIEMLFMRLKYFLFGIMLFYASAFGLYIYMLRKDREKERELVWNAMHDALTGLPNRYFLRRKTKQWHRQHRKYTALFLDLENFKGINDTYGHPFGDRLLVIIARRLQKLVDKHEHVIRQGGDEFIILTTWPESAVEAYVRRVRKKIAQSATLDEIVLHPSVSIGAAHYPKDAEDFDTLLSKADLALYEAKRRKSGFVKYSESLETKAKRRYAVETQLRNADLAEEFMVLLQPQLDIESLKIVGVEALVRWQNPELGPVRPEEFVAVAEETAMIRRIGHYVLEQACTKTLEVWKKTGARFRLSVNTSAEELLYEDFVEQVFTVLDTTGFPAAMLTIEVTESVFIEQTEEAKTVLGRLRRHGIGVSLDDFGTGYSSLSMLQGLPLTELKIDRSFIAGLHRDNQKLAIVNAIISLGRMFALTVVAEGADAPQLELLRENGCSVLQGFYYAVPQDTEALIDFVQENQRVALTKGAIR